MYDIATSTQAEFTKVAEAQLSDANAKFVAMIDTAAKNAPAGSETAVTHCRRPRCAGAYRPSTRAR